ncbi:hypothetical protein DSECCO2_322000 [anaerobic digester metagenome]
MPDIQQIKQQLSQFAVERATDAAVRHFINIVAFHPNDQVVVDGNLPEFIFNDREFILRVFFDQVVQQGGFSGSQKSGQYGYRQPVVIHIIFHQVKFGLHKGNHLPRLTIRGGNVKDVRMD